MKLEATCLYMFDHMHAHTHFFLPMYVHTMCEYERV